jgi:RNA polymerase sigma-70 factor (ECF subfamily)
MFRLFSAQTHSEASLGSGGSGGVGAEIEPWRRCYREMGAKLLLYARQILQSDHFTVSQDAEDVVQTAFVRFWKHHPQAQPDQYGLLFSAVRTAALDALRSSSRRAKREDTYSLEILDFRDGAAVSGGSEPWFESGDRADSSGRLQEALQKLPAEQREIIVMKVWGELTFAQIAQNLKLSPNTVASRYRLGMNTLRGKLKGGAYAGV